MLPFFWGGDNDASFSAINGLPTVVTAGLNAGMSGISLWMSDLGGYNKTARRDPDPVLFARWTEYSALSPGMEVMSSYNFGPWDYGDEALQDLPQLFRAAHEPVSVSLRRGAGKRAQRFAHDALSGADASGRPGGSRGGDRILFRTRPAGRAGAGPGHAAGRLFAGRRLDRLLVRQTDPGTADDCCATRRSIALPLYVRSGAILPKIPEDVMTLVPASEYADKNVKSMDNRRVYEIYPTADRARNWNRFRISRAGTSTRATRPERLTITGAPAHIILRWRFADPRTAMVNGRAVPAVRTADGASVEFDHSDRTELRWQ